MLLFTLLQFQAPEERSAQSSHLRAECALKAFQHYWKLKFVFWRVILAETSWSLEIVASVDQNALQPQGMLYERNNVFSLCYVITLYTASGTYVSIWVFFIQYRFVVLLKSFFRFSSNSICVHIHWALHPLHHRQFSVTSLLTHPSAFIFTKYCASQALLRRLWVLGKSV